MGAGSPDPGRCKKQKGREERGEGTHAQAPGEGYRTPARGWRGRSEAGPPSAASATSRERLGVLAEPQGTLTSPRIRGTRVSRHRGGAGTRTSARARRSRLGAGVQRLQLAGARPAAWAVGSAGDGRRRRVLTVTAAAAPGAGGGSGGGPLAGAMWPLLVLLLLGSASRGEWPRTWLCGSRRLPPPRRSAACALCPAGPAAPWRGWPARGARALDARARTWEAPRVTQAPPSFLASSPASSSSPGDSGLIAFPRSPPPGARTEEDATPRTSRGN